MYGNGRKRLLLGVGTVLGIHSLVGHPFPCRHCYFLDESGIWACCVERDLIGGNFVNPRIFKNALEII